MQQAARPADWRWRHKVECRNQAAPHFWPRDFVSSASVGGVWILVERGSPDADGTVWLATPFEKDDPLEVEYLSERLLRHDSAAMSLRLPLKLVKERCEQMGWPLPKGCNSL